MPLVSVEHLTKVFASRRGGRPPGEETGIFDVSFELGLGETLGVVGPSAAGKTTIGRALLRLVEPTSGRVTVTPPGRSPVVVTELPPRDLRRFRRHAQMIFQDPYASLNPRLSVGETLAEPLVLHDTLDRTSRVDRCRELLATVGLDPGLLDTRPGRLSGGERQRVGIARAIATQPCLIVADEPVTALDVSVQAQILNLLADLQARLGLAYLLISHDLAVVAHLANRIAVVSAGRIVELDETEAILGQPRHPVTRALVASARREGT